MESNFMVTMNDSDLKYPSLHALTCTFTCFISRPPLLWFEKWIIGIMSQPSEQCGCPSSLCDLTVGFISPNARLLVSGRQPLPPWFLTERHLLTPIHPSHWNPCFPAFSKWAVPSPRFSRVYSIAHQRRTLVFGTL